MNIPVYCVYFYIFIVVFILCYLEYVIKRIPTTSIMYRNFIGKVDCLTHRVKSIAIIHLAITFPLLNVFTDELFAHWGIGCWDYQDNFVEILTAGVRIHDRYVVMYYVPKKAFKIINKSDIMFVNSDNNKT